MRAGLERVTFLVDGRELTTRKEAPWGWGDGGARARDVAALTFGAHTLEAVAHYKGGDELRRALHVERRSPLGRVPSYAKDVAPIVTARCARCHANGVAHDLTGFESLSMEAPLVRASVREGRMPPDIRLDPTSAAILTAWVDGDTPR